MDNKTTSICERPYWRVSFARVLVEVDATKGLVDGVEVWYKSLGKSLMLNVEYAWVPPLCEHCRIFGHFISACGKRDQTVWKSGDKVEANMSSTNKTVNVENDNDGWQNVVNRRNGRGGMSYYRQGSTNFNLNRGGGMSGRGRGYYASRFKPNNVNNVVNIGNKQYVPVNWNSDKVIIVDESMVANEVSGNGKTGGIKLKGSVENRNINTKNRFEVLGEENESEDSDSWKEVKIHVDVACDMGIPVSKILLVIDAEIEHLMKNLLVNAGMNAQRMVNDSEEATGEKVNGLYDKYFYQTYKVEVLKVKD
ncbi:zinc knuckle CX2CX4HX4C containing protein [Tanacetum coccineum]